MPLIPGLKRQSQVDLSDFEVSLDYKMSFRTARTDTQSSVPCFEKKRKILNAIYSRKVCYSFAKGESIRPRGTPGYLDSLVVMTEDN